MTKEGYFGNWLKVIDDEMLQLVKFKLDVMYKVRTVYPTRDLVFKAFHLCPYNNLKGVIIGQDPYPQKGVATGIPFGNKSETDEDNLSVSLNILKNAVIDFEMPHGLINFDQTLESWCKQGILMLNSALTVEENRPCSHMMIWRPFITKLLKNLSTHETGIVYILIGDSAKSFTPYIDTRTNYVLKERHPSWYSRNNVKMSGRVFKEANEIFKNLYNTTVEWYKEN